jgi:hypothetical protein
MFPTPDNNLKNFIFDTRVYTFMKAVSMMAGDGGSKTTLAP